MNNVRKFPLILSNFWLKVIALLTMTIDHIGYLLPYSDLALVFRYIGRLALPLFCFMIAEGAIHTKSFNKYALRLGIMASAISIAIIGTTYIPYFANNGYSMRDEGNIFLDLLLGALTIYFLRQNKWYLKLLAILPVGFGIVSFIAKALESCGCHGYILWFPFFLRTQYGWYGIVMILGFYVAHYLSNIFINYHSSITGISSDLYKGSNFERHVLNIISVMSLAVISLLFYLLGQIMPVKYVYWDVGMQLFAIVSGAFILLYNGLRGYNKKWFQYGSYLYYPIHMIILYLIFSLI